VDGVSAPDGAKTQEADAAAMAEKVGVHQVTIARLETGERRRSMDLLQRLAKALGVPVTELLA